jgi:alkanesulfonate monooxygenase SsuD/methylene tetrahydromethanopterin reductase-like flavin-dependent oxidoreductase (luciferase family)
VPAPPLSFGYLYDFRNPAIWQRPWNDLYRETLDLIAWTETVGFTGAWIPEHHAAEDGYQPAPNLILAAIAARTKTIRLGAAIALAPLYHPVRFAEECAVLDILCSQRLETALAIGYRRSEYEIYGVDFSKRGSRFDEFLHIVRGLWAGESVTVEGRHYSVKNARIVPTPPRGTIPLYIGGFTDKALARVARYADGYFGNRARHGRAGAVLPLRQQQLRRVAQRR